MRFRYLMSIFGILFLSCSQQKFNAEKSNPGDRNDQLIASDQESNNSNSTNQENNENDAKVYIPDQYKNYSDTVEIGEGSVVATDTTSSYLTMPEDLSVTAVSQSVKVVNSEKINDGIVKSFALEIKVNEDISEETLKNFGVFYQVERQNRHRYLGYIPPQNIKLGSRENTLMFDLQGLGSYQVAKLQPSVDQSYEKDLDELAASNLILRYFLDETSSGSEPTEVADAATDPLNLKLDYDSGLLSYHKEVTGKGLRFTKDAGSTASAAIPMVGTKIFPNFKDSHDLTIEVVLKITDSEVDGSRLVHLGSPASNSRFSLRSYPNGYIAFARNGTIRAGWKVTSQERMVLTLVMDSKQEEAVDRINLYVNGEKHEKLDLSTGQTPDFFNFDSVEVLAQNTRFSLDETNQTEHFYLGNRLSGGYSFTGSIYYAAIYSSFLTEDQIKTNSQRLLRFDDT